MPGSDDEMIVDSDDEDMVRDVHTVSLGKRKAESNLQTWIKHLSLLHKEEQRKVRLSQRDEKFGTDMKIHQYKEKRKNALASSEPYVKVKVPKVCSDNIHMWCLLDRP